MAANPYAPSPPRAGCDAAHSVEGPAAGQAPMGAYCVRGRFVPAGRVI